MTLRTVAERAELSESFLSQVERGRANASIASLQRIAAALGVNVADLFEPNGRTSRPRVLRRESRPALTFGTLGRKYMLTPRPLEHLQVIVGELDAGGSTGDEPYTHGDSEELLVVLEGSVHLQLGAEVFELSHRRLDRLQKLDSPPADERRGWDGGGHVDHQSTELLSPAALVGGPAADVELVRCHEALRGGRGSRCARPRGASRRVPLAARPVGLRQDDHAAPDRRLRAARRGRGPDRRQRRLAAPARTSAR